MSAVAAPVQVGIFSNDLCIGYRIIMHELLDNHVFRVYEAAKEIHQKRPKEAFKPMFERGIKSINAWDNQLKEQYRVQVLAQYRQLTDLYHHIYLMYVQEMYDQSLDDVTVRVNIPALTTMLHLFLRLACNHQVILSGEYINTMQFPGRVLFVETILRRLLYELLVQQNNIKSISTGKGRPPAQKKPAPPKTISVQSEADVVSADMTMGTQRQAAPRLSPTVDTAPDANRFWMEPTATPSETSGNAELGPAYQPRPSPLNSVVSDMVHSKTTTVTNDTALTGLVPTKTAPELVSSRVPRITSLPQQPVISGSVVAPEQKSNLFELQSRFTPFKPGGTSYPDASVSAADRKDIQVDSLELLPSNQSFTAEARKLLENPGTDTITPFDSVTNVAANPDQRPPLFFEPLCP